MTTLKEAVSSPACSPPWCAAVLPGSETPQNQSNCGTNLWNQTKFLSVHSLKCFASYRKLMVHSQYPPDRSNSAMAQYHWLRGGSEQGAGEKLRGKVTVPLQWGAHLHPSALTNACPCFVDFKGLLWQRCSHWEKCRSFLPFYLGHCSLVSTVALLTEQPGCSCKQAHIRLI